MKQEIRRTARRVLSIGLTAAFLCAAAAAAPADTQPAMNVQGESAASDQPRFHDMAGHWAAACVEALAEKGIVLGSDDGLFHPQAYVTTAQFTAMVVRSLSPADAAPTPEGAPWYAGYAQIAYEAEVIDDADLAAMDEPMERRFAARIGHLALQRLRGEPDERDTSAAMRLSDLNDCASCVEHVAQMYTKGIIGGYPDGAFRGNAPATRAEAAVILARMLDETARISPANLIPATDVILRVTADEALSMMRSDAGALLVDVRLQEEYASGHIPGSINVPLTNILDSVSSTDIPADKNTPVIVYCQKGSRSLQAYRALKDYGYVSVYDLGGIEDWPYELSKE